MTAARRFIDVSSNNHPGGVSIAWDRVKAAGIDGVFVKLTEGTDYANPFAFGDCAQAEAAGLEVGLYHFARPGLNLPGREAQWFLSHIGSTEGSWRRALDLEDGAAMGWAALDAWVQSYLGAVRTDDLYVNDYYRTNLAHTGKALLVRVWAAEPGATSIPPGFDAVQYGQGYVDGIPGMVDLDLVAWPGPGEAGGSPAPPATGPEPPPAVLTAGLPNLFAGAQGGTVAVAQRLLGIQGHPVKVDGVFGPSTTAAVQGLQAAKGLTVDGIVGPVTWLALLA